MRRPAVLLLVASAGCSRCSHTPGPVVVDASTEDAAAAALTVEWQLRPVAFTSEEGMLQRLVDGTIVFTHGPTIDRLAPNGVRARLTYVKSAGQFVPLGTVGGTVDDLFVSTVEDHYPSSTDSHSWRIAFGVEKPILEKSVFYMMLAPWKDGRLLGLRAAGASHSISTMLPWTPEGFSVALGRTDVKVPIIPAQMFVEDMIAFPSGTVLAAATKYDESGMMIGREGAFAIRWKDAAETGVVETLPEECGSSQRIAARSEDDVWIGGSTPRLGHWDGKAWSHEEPAEGGGGARSMAITSDGALWTVAVDGAVARRDPKGKWSSVDLPTTHTDFARPRVHWFRGNLVADHERDLGLKAEGQSVVASGTDVWVSAMTPDRGTVLFHWSRTAVPPASVTDLDEEDSRREGDDQIRPATSTCRGFFVTGGPPTTSALNRVRAAPMTVVVVARVRGERMIGSAFDSLSREFADEQATKWRNLGLRAEVDCGYPPLESLVVDPNAKDQ